MPSKEEMCVLASSKGGATTQDFMARDVEELVSEIKENLRLSGLKARRGHRSRASPYRVPGRGRGWGEKGREGDDPYEMLQELLRDGGLIKEAVRRLQRGLAPARPAHCPADSDEEARSPRSPLRLCHLEV